MYNQKTGMMDRTHDVDFDHKTLAQLKQYIDELIVKFGPNAKTNFDTTEYSCYQYLRYKTPETNVERVRRLDNEIKKQTNDNARTEALNNMTPEQRTAFGYPNWGQ